MQVFGLYVSACIEWFQDRSSRLKLWQIFGLFLAGLVCWVVVAENAPGWAAQLYGYAIMLPLQIFLLFAMRGWAKRKNSEQKKRNLFWGTKAKLKSFKR
ncbi:hypothetical protein [Cribrihabitans neustonicus]|uniref:hypothetical protein n=1 Tax=Cribrihabitans neustonicus TaxID=1429085 RepID=UPI003B59DC49